MVTTSRSTSAKYLSTAAAGPMPRKTARSLSLRMRTVPRNVSSARSAPSASARVGSCACAAPPPAPAPVRAEPADEKDLPPALKPFKAVPPLITDIDLSLDDKFLYVSCWGTGEMRQYDVSDPMAPRLAGSVKLGGIVRRTPHPKTNAPLNGGPQMVEISRDGKRVYFTNSLYSSWDDQFYPEGLQGWMVKLDVDQDGGIAVDPRFLLETGATRPHQVRLEGGDASTDTFCFPS